jgi:oligopeptide/dipeptide ABC transporter ATP-binding protein
VMYRGKLVETAPADTLFARPMHPYTQLLLRSVPVPDPKAEAARRKAANGAETVNSEATPDGCPFASRCPRARFPDCATAPALLAREPDHFVACRFS